MHADRSMQPALPLHESCSMRMLYARRSTLAAPLGALRAGRSTVGASLYGMERRRLHRRTLLGIHLIETVAFTFCL